MDGLGRLENNELQKTVHKLRPFLVQHLSDRLCFLLRPRHRELHKASIERRPRQRPVFADGFVDVTVRSATDFSSFKVKYLVHFLSFDRQTRLEVEIHFHRTFNLNETNRNFVLTTKIHPRSNIKIPNTDDRSPKRQHRYANDNNDIWR